MHLNVEQRGRPLLVGDVMATARNLMTCT